MTDPVVLLSTGDVVGPNSATDGTMVLFDGTTGKKVKGNNAVVTAQGLALLDDADAAANRATIGLDQLNNTSDVNKPVSTAQQVAINNKASKGANSDITSISGLTTALTVVQGGTGVSTLPLLKAALLLDQVNNTSDANKPVSTAQQVAINVSHSQIKLTTSGSFTVPGNTTTIFVTGVAGGGGGGGGSNGNIGIGSGGSGGGSGQSIIKVPYTVTPGQVIGYVIGAAGGAGGAGQGAGIGGGNTSMTSLFALSGGSGGAGGANSTTIAIGPFGGTGFPNGCDSTDVSPGSAGGSGGSGATSPFGGGGPGGRNSSVNGIAGRASYGFGSGGGGGGGYYTAGAGTGAAGGAGGAGLIVIEW